MHGNPSGLVESHQAIVFQQHGKVASRSAPRHHIRHDLLLFGHALRDTNGWNTHPIPSRQTGVGTDPSLVNPHLATANHAVDMGFGNTFKLAH